MKTDRNDQAIDRSLVNDESSGLEATSKTGTDVAGDEAEATEAISFELPLDDIPEAALDEASADVPDEEPRSGWRLFSAEDLPQVSLRQILGGDYLIGSFLRRQIWFILFLVVLTFLYITNRYASQQEILEEEALRKELVEKKNYALTQYAELTARTRQSSLERLLKTFGDSTLLSAKEPPFIIYKQH